MGWRDQNPGARLILTGGNADASGRTEAAVMHVLRLPAPSGLLAYGANMLSEVVLNLNELTKK